MNELINEKPTIRLIFFLWKKYKGYCDDCFPSFEVYLDMIDSFSTNHKKDMSDGRFFNNIFLNSESSIAYDGENLRYILHYEVCDILKKCLTRP